MLYQKYRPKDFDSVIGHTKIVQELKSHIKKKTLPQSILIDGLTGSGKTTLGYILNKAVTCSNPKEDGNPCNSCANCTDINNEQFTYSGNWFNASDLDTDAVRDIKQIANTFSITAKKQFIVIDEIQELKSNKKAQKVLLSILEKVNKDTHILLLSMDATGIDPAIINRCNRYRLQPLSFEEVSEYLYMIVQSEGIVVDEQKANAIFVVAEHSNGSMRAATTMLERVIESNLWDESELIRELGLVSTDTLYSVIDSLLNGSVDCLKTEINEDVIARIKSMLQLLLKQKLGYVLNQWEGKQIGGLSKKHSIETIMSTISILNQIQSLPYLNKQILEFYLLMALYENQKGKVSVSQPVQEQLQPQNQVEQPVRRERTRK